MHIDWRAVIIGIIGALVGIVLVCAGAWAYVMTPKGQSFMRDLLVAQVSKNVALDADTASSSLIAQQPILPVPEAWVNTDYFDAINNIVNDMVLINNTNVELGPVLSRLNALTLSGSYDGFYDLMTRARQLANTNQALAAQFMAHLTDLSSANDATEDAVTKSETFTVLSAGQSLGQSLTAYGSAVQNILYGDTPTSEQIAAFEAQVAQTTAASQNFADALNPLLMHIEAGDEAIIKAATSTSSQ